jgi:hypothetical protein
MVGLLVSSFAGDALAGWGSAGAFGWGKVQGFSIELAGRDLNGTALNGDSLDGRYVVGISALGVVLDGAPMEEVSIDESQLVGVDWRGKKRKKASMVGATFDAILDDGSFLPVTIAAAAAHPEHAHKDVWGYEVWYETDDAWEPLCGRDDDGIALKAVPLAGTWNHDIGVPGGGSWVDSATTFTLACEGYVLSKCVFAGYKPWRSGKWCSPGAGCETVSFAGHHQACTRALRADYFGDGMTHTTDGVLLNMYDAFGIRTDGDAWASEAEWDADGALCIAQSRLPSSPVAPMDAAGCGGFESGALLVTELP